MSLNLEDIINQVRVIEETKINKEKGGYKGDPRLLKFKKNCSYTLRLVPSIKDASNNFVAYKEIGFNSRVDGKYVFGGRAPQDAGLKEDLFKETQWKHFSDAKERGDEVEKTASYKLFPQRKELMNAYLVSVEGEDAEAKEKIGQVIVISYPAQVSKDGVPMSDIYKKIHAAIFGDMAKKIGSKALDLSAKGRSLIVKVTEKAGYHNYSETAFDDAEDLGLSEAQIKEILGKIYNLSEFVPEVKTKEEIKDIVDKQWHGFDASTEDDLEPDEEPAPRINTTVSAKDDVIPMGDADDDLDKLLAD
jgi:hypothetical protein